MHVFRQDVRSLIACVLAAIVACSGHMAFADHALTQDGTGLFNVSVEATHTTWARMLTVLHRPESFSYEFDSGQLLPLRGKSSVRWIMDYVSTSTIVGREEAREIMQARGWHRHQPPPPIVIRTPTPTPVPTPTPEPTPTPDPSMIADPGLPLQERVREQMNIFIGQQQDLASQMRLARQFGQVTSEQEMKRRLALLDQQLGMFRDLYTNDEVVSRAVSILMSQRDHVLRTGRFRAED